VGFSAARAPELAGSRQSCQGKLVERSGRCVASSEAGTCSRSHVTVSTLLWRTPVGPHVTSRVDHRSSSGLPPPLLEHPTPQSSQSRHEKQRACSFRRVVCVVDASLGPKVIQTSETDEDDVIVRAGGRTHERWKPVSVTLVHGPLCTTLEVGDGRDAARNSQGQGFNAAGS
jgi:hypothetical protein